MPPPLHSYSQAIRGKLSQWLPTLLVMVAALLNFSVAAVAQTGEFFCRTVQEDETAPSAMELQAAWQSDDCLEYYRVNIVFIGQNNFTASGNPGSPYLPTNYNGQHFSEDLVRRMNEYLAHNTPPNIGNGWLYYEQEANALYGTEHRDAPAGYTPPASFIVRDPGYRFTPGCVRYDTNSYGNAAYDNGDALENAMTTATSGCLPGFTLVVAPGAGGTGIAFAPNMSYIVAGIVSGCGPAHLALHELMHNVWLKHNFFMYSTCNACSISQQENWDSCPFWGGTYNITNFVADVENTAAMEDADNNGTLLLDGADFNPDCNSSMWVAGRWYDPDHMSETHPCNACNTLWTYNFYMQQLDNGYTPLNSFIACDEPIEIDQNIMNYYWGGAFSIVPPQINLTHSALTFKDSFLDHTGLEVFINDTYFNSNGCSNGPSICLPNGGTTTLTAIPGPNIGTTASNPGSGWNNPTYAWAASNGGAIAGSTNVASITATAVGTYSVTVTNQSGCTGSASVQVHPPFEVQPLPPTSYICPHDLDTNTDNELQVQTIPDCPDCLYQWTGNSQNLTLYPINSPFATGVCCSYQSGMLYEVTVTNGVGCTASGQTILDISAPPQPIISGTEAGADNGLLCVGDIPTTLHVEPALPNYTYQWAFNGSIPPTGETGTQPLGNSPDQTILTSTSGVYIGNYSVTVTDDHGCTGSTLVYIYPCSFTAPIVIQKDISGTNGCLTLTARNGNTGALLSGKWLYNGNIVAENVSSINVSYEQSETYEFVYSFTCIGGFGCSESVTTTVTLADFPDFALNFTGTYNVADSDPSTPELGTISGNVETWEDVNLNLNAVINIPTERKLIIKNSTINFLSPPNSIIVEKGADLVIENSILQGRCDHHWNGIFAKAGISAGYLSYTDPDMAATDINIGYAKITGSTIRNARIGVANAYVAPGLWNPTTGTEGGVLKIENTVFEDNGIAIVIVPYRSSAQPHLITGNTIHMIRNTPFDGLYWHPNFLQPIGIAAQKTKLLNALHNNRFESTMPAATPLNKRGIGMYLGNMHVIVGANVETDPANPSTYEYEGLFKGIDVYNTLTVMKRVDVLNQNMRDTRKGITLNGTVGSKILDNTFEIPQGDLLENDTYGLMVYEATGVGVHRNRFSANNLSGTATSGAIFTKTKYDSFLSNVTNNLFDGTFKAATQFNNDNSKLYTNCNAYDDCEIDWHLTPNAILPKQGICDPIDPALALRTHWHFIDENGSTISYNDQHIINQNLTFTLRLNIDNSPQSDPLDNTDYVQGLVDVIPCSFWGISQNLSCTVTFPIEGAGITECGEGETIEKQIYNYLESGDRDGLLALLHCVDTEWAIKLLVGTYVDEQLYEEALVQLDKLNDTDPETAEFKALYTAIINGGLADPDGSGKADMAVAAISEVSRNPQSPNKALAENILAVYRSKEYVRHAEPVPAKAVAGNYAPDFLIMPNPASHSATLSFYKPIANATELLLFNTNGQLLQNMPLDKGTITTSLPIGKLQSGIYFCRLANSGYTAKLVIVK